MISYLKGTIQHKDIKYVVIMTNGGVGYKVYTTLETLGQSSTGEQVELWIHTVVREDALDLYGFSNKRSLDFFELLLTISGIGPKSALGILSATTVDSIIEAITTGESAYLTKIAGIGKKVVEKIILELKGKIGDNFGASTDSYGVGNHDVDTIEALKSLGYTHKEAKDALDEIPKDVKTTSDKIKAALKLLGR
ncbi:MAG: Holliday junction branch migration protein RuvA [Candidatus Pacebacteria bacterium]|nr:Holliday junction branch migration protein RuvA [Candidatus Paceibacterota bacterium]